MRREQETADRILYGERVPYVVTLGPARLCDKARSLEEFVGDPHALAAASSDLRFQSWVLRVCRIRVFEARVYDRESSGKPVRSPRSSAF